MRQPARSRKLHTVATILQPADAVDCEKFRQEAFDVDRPLVMKGSAQHEGLENNAPSVFSVIPKWFSMNKQSRHYEATPYLQDFSTAMFPYELMQRPMTRLANEERASPIQKFSAWLSSSEIPTYKPLAQLLQHHLDSLGLNGQGTELLRLYAPLALLLAAIEYNVLQTTQPKLTQLYIAQAPLNDLPPQLASDMHPPQIVQSAGRGDIYDSSIWLGLEPTYTPWHRDPNPNLFCQLCSSKIIRLLPPSAGERIFRSVQMQLGRFSGGSSRLRGEEMMQGPERRLLHEAVWGEEVGPDIQEARLDAGDAIYVPKGWWHSVKSGFADGRLNASANWWFR